MASTEQRKQSLRDLIDKRLGTEAEGKIVTAQDVREVLHEMVDHLVVEPEHRHKAPD